MTCAPSEDLDQSDQSLHCGSVGVKGPLFLHVDSEDSLLGMQVILLVLLCGGSYVP